MGTKSRGFLTAFGLMRLAEYRRNFPLEKVGASFSRFVRNVDILKYGMLKVHEGDRAGYPAGLFIPAAGRFDNKRNPDRLLIECLRVLNHSVFGKEFPMVGCYYDERFIKDTHAIQFTQEDSDLLIQISDFSVVLTQQICALRFDLFLFALVQTLFICHPDAVTHRETCGRRMIGPAPVVGRRRIIGEVCVHIVKKEKEGLPVSLPDPPHCLPVDAFRSHAELWSNRRGVWKKFSDQERGKKGERRFSVKGVGVVVVETLCKT